MTEEIPLTAEELEKLYQAGFRVVKAAPVNPEMMQSTPVSIKLSKNTKGYNWDIKIDELNPKKVQEVNDVMRAMFEFGLENKNEGEKNESTTGMD